MLKDFRTFYFYTSKTNHTKHQRNFRDQFKLQYACCTQSEEKRLLRTKLYRIQDVGLTMACSKCIGATSFASAQSRRRDVAGKKNKSKYRFVNGEWSMVKY